MCATWWLPTNLCSIFVFPPVQLRLFVCNNDDTIKMYSLSGGTLATVLRCPVAINYCALSPSGR